MNVTAESFKIDGVTIPTPTSYTFDIEDLSSDATGRTLDGVMHKDVVAVKDYYTITWKHLSRADAAMLLNLVDGKSRVELLFIDPRLPNALAAGPFYVGKRSGKAVNLRNEENTWTDITMQFTRI